MAIKGGNAEAEAMGDELDLPARVCSQCGEYQWVRQLARYDVSVPQGLDRCLFLVSAGWRELRDDDFDRLISRFDFCDPNSAKLLPGMKIGTPILRLRTAPKDVVFDGLVPLISERALDCVRSRSIQINAVPIDLIDEGTQRHRYYNILTPVLRLADVQWMSAERDECLKCRAWWNKPGVRLPKTVKPSKARIVKSRWPDAAGVVYAEDIESIYYSPEFVRVCHDAKLTGFGFQQVFWV